MSLALGCGFPLKKKKIRVKRKVAVRSMAVLNRFLFLIDTHSRPFFRVNLATDVLGVVGVDQLALAVQAFFDVHQLIDDVVGGYVDVLFLDVWFAGGEVVGYEDIATVLWRNQRKR